MNEETQMTASKTTGASSAKRNSDWQSIDWQKAEALVFRLQMRIAKAEREGKRSKVKALQRLLTTSFCAKCLSVRRVTSNTGKRTAGIDGVLLTTQQQKLQMVSDLKRNGYKPSPLRRIHIRKKSGKLRPLSIPTMKDRCMQAVWLLALIPIAEERADPNAYGFRPKRSTHDAIEQCFNTLSRKISATWILEGDIKDCFSRINHDWLLENIPMDKVILRKFLKAGFVENGEEHPTTQGVGQGGIISPTLAVMALSGLECKFVNAKQKNWNKDKTNLIFYADDFIVTAKSESIIHEKVMPIMQAALSEVGLELSQEKTKITRIKDGFDFLGFNVRKYQSGKLLIKPSKASITKFLNDIRARIKEGIALPTDKLIYQLNSKIIGWTNYYRGSVASKVFSMIDNEIYLALVRWCLKRHSCKGKRWIMKKYFGRFGNDNWRFHCITKDKEGKPKPLYLRKAAETHIRRHKKIKAEANPFDSRYKEYFKQRENERKLRSRTANMKDAAGLRIIQSYEGLSGVR